MGFFCITIGQASKKTAKNLSFFIAITLEKVDHALDI